MSFSVWQRYITDSAGNVLNGASVEVRKESDGGLATLFADASGSGLSNPFSTGLDGLARFYTAADTSGYKVTVESDALPDPAVFRSEPIGNAQLRDVGTELGNVLTIDDADNRYSVLLFDNLNATTDPSENDDANQGYASGSRWYNTVSEELFLCINDSPGAAQWVKASLTLDELGSMATRNAGIAATEFRTNADNDAAFLSKPLSVIEIAGTTYKMLKTTSASDVVITIPEDATENLMAGFQVEVQRAGDGLVTIQAEGSDVLNAADNFNQIDVKYGAASIVKEISGNWWMTGALANAMYTAFTAPTVSDPPTQAEVQSIANALEILIGELNPG